MHISKAKIDDLEEILALQKLAYRKEALRYNDFTIPPMTQTLEEIISDYKTAVFLKAEIDGKIIGSIKGNVDGDTCHVGRLMVHPDNQGKGIGKKLIQSLEKTMTDEHKTNRFELFTGELSFDNIKLYESQGYRIFRNEPYDSVKNMVFMEKYN